MADGRAGSWRRREVLAGLAAGASAVAGCADSPASPAPAETGSGPSDTTATPTATRTDQSDEAETEPGTETERETETGRETATETEVDDGYERITVTAADANGTELATVGVRVADTSGKRYTGLSDTDSLAPDEGMWFVHPEEGRQAYVMRGMSIPLDIVFVDANGTVTRVFHADVDGTDAPYEARAKYVLEVNRGWANRTGLEVGDRVVPA